MIANKNLKLLGNSSVSLTITVDKESIQKEYDELVTKYSKSIRIKGFRQGKVPTGVLIRKFGPSLIGEAAEKIIHKSLEEALETIDKKPLPYYTPEVDSDDSLKLGQDFTFKISYDTYPDVELSEYHGLEYEKMRVEITKNDEDRELKRLQEQNSIVVDKEEGGVEKGNIVNIDYVEIDEQGNEKENSKRESFVFEVGTGYNLHKIDEDIIGMKKDEVRIIKKSYQENLENKDLAGKDVQLKVRLNSLKEKQLPEINDELAQDISDKYETLEDLKKDIRNKLDDLAVQKVREQSISQLLDKIVEGSKIELPESMVEHELNNQWQNFITRSQTDEKNIIRQLEAQGKNKEDIIKDWRPDVERRLKLQLVVSKMLGKEDISVNEADVDDKIRKEADTRNISFDTLKDEMTKNNYLEFLKSDIKTEKLYDILLESAARKKGKEINFLDLIQGNY